MAKFRESYDQVVNQRTLDAAISVNGGLAPATLAARLNKGEPVRIATFGNSFTIGSGCGETTYHDEVTCSWPRRLERRFAEVLPASPVTWLHKAMNGQTFGEVAMICEEKRIASTPWLQRGWLQPHGRSAS